MSINLLNNKRLNPFGAKRANFLPIPETSTNTQRAVYHYIRFCQLIASTYCLSAENPLASRALQILSIGCLTALAFYSHWVSIAIATAIIATKIIANQYCPTIRSPSEQLSDIIVNETSCLVPDAIIKEMLSYLGSESEISLRKESVKGLDWDFNIVKLKQGTLASAAHDGTIRLWNSSGSKAIAVLRGHQGLIEDMIELKNGNFASSAHDHTIKIWNPNQLTNQFSARITLEGIGTDWVNLIRELKNGNLISKSRYKRIILWDPNQTKPIASLPPNSDDFFVTHYIRELKNGNIVSTDDAGIIKILNPKNFEVIAKLEENTIKVTYIEELKSGNIASLFDNGAIKILDPKNLDAVVTLPKCKNSQIKSIRELKNGSIVATDEHGLIKILSTHDLATLVTLPPILARIINFFVVNKLEPL